MLNILSPPWPVTPCLLLTAPSRAPAWRRGLADICRMNGPGSRWCTVAGSRLQLLLTSVYTVFLPLTTRQAQGEDGHLVTLPSPAFQGFRRRQTRTCPAPRRCSTLATPATPATPASSPRSLVSAHLAVPSASHSACCLVTHALPPRLQHGALPLLQPLRPDAPSQHVHQQQRLRWPQHDGGGPRGGRA